MKHKLIFRIFAVALTLSLTMLALPLSPALALAETITVDPDEGTRGDDLDISGTGTLGQEYYIYFSSQPADVSDDIDTNVTAYERLASVTAGGFEGTFSTMNLKVPDELTDGDDVEDVHGGTYYIYMTRDTSERIRAMTTFTVTGVANIIDFEPDEGTVGTEVEISGQGFAPDEVIIVEYDGDEIDIYSGDTEADEDGKFTLFIIIPESTFGENTITIIGEDSLAELELTFTVVPEIVIDPEEGEAGTNVTIIGTGFDRYGDVVITFNGDEVKEKRAGSDGSFDTFFTVPDVAEGAYDILAEDEDNNDIFAEAEFTVLILTVPSITVDLTSGNVGDEVTVSGVEFGAELTVTLYLDDVSVGTTTTDEDGEFSGTFDIPASTGGSHTIKAEDTADNSATATLNVVYEIATTPTTGASGAIVAIAGTGFGASKLVTITYNNAVVITDPTTILTDAYGTFVGVFDLPAAPAGTYTVEVSDGTYSASVNFVALYEAAISATSGNVGDEVAVIGTGFGVTRSITITYDATAVTPTAPIVTSADGIFIGTFTVPASVGGAHTITVSDGVISEQFAFVMEQEAPPTPQPLLPLGGDKPNQPVQFDWADVTDPSGVTYTLQIARDQNFTTLVLEKTGLTASEYTLTEEEKLESTKKENPYYWQVQAVDGASNESGWGTGSFYIGGFAWPTMPDWVKYLLLGLGILAAGVIGFWLGTRTAYSSF